MRTQLLAVPLAASHASTSYANNVPVLTANRISSPWAFARLKVSLAGFRWILFCRESLHLQLQKDPLPRRQGI